MANRKSAAKQARLDARAAQILEQSEREARTRNIIISVFAVLILGGGFAIWFLSQPPPPPKPDKTAVNASYAVPDEGHTHVADGTTVTYKHQPPSSGNHYGTPHSPWGPTRDAIPRETYVHNLEHGGIILLYHCSGSECDTIFNQASDLDSKLPSVTVQGVTEVKFLSFPYNDTTPKKYAVLAWDREMDLDSFDTNLITAFYNTYIEHGREDIP